MDITSKYGLSIQWDIISHEKEWSNDTCYNMDEPWKHWAQWKKADPKGTYVISFHLYKITRIGKPRECLPGGNGSTEWRVTENRFKVFFLGWWKYSRFS